jgi:hypothetical protein
MEIDEYSTLEEQVCAKNAGKALNNLHTSTSMLEPATGLFKTAWQK